MLNNNQNILDGLAALDINFSQELLIDIPKLTKLCLDSRQVNENTVFVGIMSKNYEAEHFIGDAKSNGSHFALVETNIQSQHGQIFRVSSMITVNVYRLSSRLYDLALAFYFGDKSKLPRITAITGTNGKTSIASIVPQLASLANVKSVSVGTLGVHYYENGNPKKVEGTINTTPDLLSIMHQLKQASINGYELVCLEASSHGIEQNRLGDLPLKCAVFTNLTQDHLDYHKDMDAYALAKRKLLNQPQIGYLVLNADDQESLNWAQNTPTNTAIRWYSILPLKQDKLGYWASEIVYRTDGLSFLLHCNCDNENNVLTSFQVNAFLLGQFNVSNLLASIATLHMQGFDLKELITNILHVKSVVGRMEVFPSDRATMLVDYAHTPDALEQALKACKLHAKGDLICVFGCGGNRDKTKRAMMGKVADNYCNSIVLTNDNPRNEEPMAIISDIQQGITKLSRANRVAIELDRERAILQALENTSADDLILIAGKGHETYIEVNNELRFYDERAFVNKLSKLISKNHAKPTAQKDASGPITKRDCL